MLHMPQPCIIHSMSDAFDDDRNWINSILQQTGWSATELARRAKVHQTTITRKLNDASHPYRLAERTKAAIARTIGLLPKEPAAVFPRQPVAGFYEPDAVEWTAQTSSGDPDIDGQIARLATQRPHCHPWILRSRGLEGIGFFPGDVLLIDLNEVPKNDDIVCAQIFDWPRNRAETVFRVFTPPYLVSAGDGGKISRPLVVDDENVIIRGVMVGMWRPRRAAA